MNNKAAIEKEVPGYPGWIKLQKGGSRRYVSPGGAEISANAFMRLQKDYGFGNDIPESAVAATFITKRPARFFGTTDSRPSSPNQNQNQHEVVLEMDNAMPDPKPRPGKSHGTKASPKELSDGIYITLSIVTAIVSLLLQTPDLAMTEPEAKNIAIPAGNLMSNSKLNEKFGRIIADSGDWQMLGYALFLYASRVTETMQQKGLFNVKRREPGGHAPSASPGSTGNAPEPSASSNGNGYNGAYLPSSHTSLRGFTTPPGIR